MQDSTHGTKSAACKQVAGVTALVVLFGSYSFFTGCSGSAHSETQKNADSKPGTVVADHWFLITMQGKKVGHAHMVVEESSDEEKRFRNRYEAEMTVGRGGTGSTQKVEIETLTSAEGEIISLKSSISLGESGKRSVEGRVVEDVQLLANITTTAADGSSKTDAFRMAWRKKLGGYFTEERSLRTQPLKAGETRTLEFFDTTVMGLTTATYVAQEWEKLALMDETKRVLRIAKKVKMGQTEIEGVIWCDEKGIVIKELMTGTQLEQFLVTKSVALAPFDATKLDLNAALQIKAKRIADPHQTVSATYRVKVKEAAASRFFDHCGSQLVEDEKGKSALLHVRAVTPASSVDPALVDAPVAGDLQPNALIQSDARNVVALSQQIKIAESDPWSLALAIERLVHRSIRKKNFSTAFATAAEVANALEGDCTEHAVLVAAICRARKLPARVVFGLVYYEDPKSGPGFAYHMWNEVFISDKWLPLDATLGRGGIGAAHIKLSDSNLAGASAFSAFLPIAQLASRLEVDVINVSHRKR